MAIPTRHIGRIKAGHQLGLDHDVLQHFVDRMAYMDVAVGVGRAVMQDEHRLAGIVRADGLVKRLLLPLLEHARLALGQVAAHGEGRVRETDGLFVVFLLFLPGHAHSPRV